MFVSVQIASELEPSALLAPDSAVLCRSGEKNTRCRRAWPGGKFDPRTVALAWNREHNMYEVISGLNEASRVVTDPASSCWIRKASCARPSKK